jgi:hypothetical protein
MSMSSSSSFARIAACSPWACPFWALLPGASLGVGKAWGNAIAGPPALCLLQNAFHFICHLLHVMSVDFPPLSCCGLLADGECIHLLLQLVVQLLLLVLLSGKRIVLRLRLLR